MIYTARTFLDAMGGYRDVATALQKKPTTVHTQMQNGVFPAAWYDALCSLARQKDIEEPPRSLFSFLELPKHGEETVEAVCHG